MDTTDGGLIVKGWAEETGLGWRDRMGCASEGYPLAVELPPSVFLSDSRSPPEGQLHSSAMSLCCSADLTRQRRPTTAEASETVDSVNLRSLIWPLRCTTAKAS